MIERSAGPYFAVDDFARLGLSDHYPPLLPAIERLHYHRLPQRGGPTQRREVEVVCSLYFDDNDGIDQPIDPLPLGQHGPRGLKYEDYKLALTEDLLAAVFHTPGAVAEAPVDLLDWELGIGGLTARDVLNDTVRSGYVRGSELAARFGVPRADLAGQYWLRSGIAGFADRANHHYYLPQRYTDPFGARTTLAYDAHDLYVASSTDALQNRVTVTHFDHRVLAPLEIEDVNGNHTEACFDILGRVIAVAVKGKLRGDGWEGDDLAGFEELARVNPVPEAVQAFCTATTLDDSRARDWLRRAGTRFVYHFGETRNAVGDIAQWADRPAMACAIVRERHAQADGPDNSPLQVALECADGSGAVLMKKQQAEPEAEGGPLRWIVNGFTVLNNKGKPVKQYEPFFSDDFGCQLPREQGVTPLLYYDAAGRLVRTEMPDGTLSRVEFSPWHQRSFDASDTVLESPWYLKLGTPFPIETRLPTGPDGHVTVAPDVRARWLSAQHANTPSLTVFDSLGREQAAVDTRRAGQSGDAVHHADQAHPRHR